MLDVLVQTRRNKRAALKLMRKLLKKYGFVPDKLVTDDLRSYGAAALMGLQPVILASQNAMSAVDGATIERRIPINRPDEGRGRCRGSRAWDPRKDFSLFMPQPTTLSTSNVISPQQERTEPSGRRPCRRGVKSWPWREPDLPGDLLRALIGNVTELAKQLCGFRWAVTSLSRWYTGRPTVSNASLCWILRRSPTRRVHDVLSAEGI